MPGVAARASGLIRVVHPFPSLLTSIASGVIATLAGGDVPTVVRLFLAMLGIQVAIGALNDVIDAPLDRIAKPRKPIASGLVTRRVGLVIAGGGAAVGIGLSVGSGPSTTLVGLACLGLGWLYDVRLSRTALSWLPLALALPLLPIHAWLGAAGMVPVALLGLVPIGVLGGAGLALANAIVDVDRDADARRSAVVVRLGRSRAWLLQTVLLGLAAGLVIVFAPGAGGTGAPAGVAAVGIPFEVLAAIRRWSLAVGCGAAALGAIILASPGAHVRERGWELEAFGVAVLGVGWLAGVGP